ncbi:MAG: hypothetical protein KJO04_07250 [Bacteroidia bacterium]|nr:hypothetical protein [Bacteroidia bacterium]
MKRLLIDYKKLDQETALLLLDAYPDGYGDEDIISFKTAQGDIIQAVELRTSEIWYLVKINKNTSHFLSEALSQTDHADEIPEDIRPPDADLDPDIEAEVDGKGEEY